LSEEAEMKRQQELKLKRMLEERYAGETMRQRK